MRPGKECGSHTFDPVIVPAPSFPKPLHWSLLPANLAGWVSQSCHMRDLLSTFLLSPQGSDGDLRLLIECQSPVLAYLTLTSVLQNEDIGLIRQIRKK